MSIGFYTAVSGLQAAQRQLDTASHNISNADTEGYSRQTVSLSAAQPQGATGSFVDNVGNGTVGRGVDIQSITRVRDQFIDNQVRAQSSDLGESTAKANMLGQVEDVFGEPSENGLGAQITQFFNNWQSLSGDPANKALRTNLRDQAEQLASTFQTLNTQLTDLAQQTNDQITSEVSDINTLTKQISQLNPEIAAATSAGQSPNDLLDQQDLLIEKLSSKIKIQVNTESDGSRNVYIGGQPLVTHGSNFQLSAVPSQLNGFTTIQYGPTGQAAPILGGELKGLVDTRDITLSSTNPQGFITQLNNLASGFMASVNAVHSIGFGPTGVTGQTFFDGTDASDIQVNANIVNDTALANGLDVIAAASNDPGSLTGGVGDGDIAVRIAQLAQGKIMDGGTNTFDTSYKNLIADVGTQAQLANKHVSTQTTLVSSIKERRDSTSGVSTDEEMADVVRFQKAYAASARVISTISEMMDILVNLGK